MKRIIVSRWSRIGLLLLTAFFLSCGTSEKKLIFSGEAEPADFSLSNTRPETFQFEIPADAAGPFTFAIALTYFPNQMQNWEALPLYYTLGYPDGREEDKRFSLKLKDEAGEWRGTLQKNDTDRLFEESISDGLALPAGKYAFKLFGDSKDLAKPILGIVRVVMKVYSE
jgi:hypothetical protein